jgi:hypothetical protein
MIKQEEELSFEKEITAGSSTLIPLASPRERF